MKRFLLIALLALNLGILSGPLVVFAQYDEPVPVYEPVFQVPIPGFDFKGSVLITGDAAQDDCDPHHVCVTTIGRYINAVFRYGLGAGIIFTIVLIMIGGVEWMIGSTVGGITRAQARIKNASIGLLLLLTATVFLTFINPFITAMNSLSIDTVKKVPPLDRALVEGASVVHTDIQNSEGELVHAADIQFIVDPDTGESVRNPNIDTRLGTGSSLVYEDMVQWIQNAAIELKKNTQGKNHIQVIAAFADPKKTMKRFYDNCLAKNGVCREITCNPLPDSYNYIEGDYDSGFKFTSHAEQEMKRLKLDENQFVDLMAGLAAGSTERRCPYETGYSVGVICNDQDERNITDLDCQVKLEWAMKNLGFCRSYFQPWYYEYNGKQSSVKNCDWTVGAMLKPNSICHNPTGDEVEYTITGESSACAVNYEEQIVSCLRFDLKTGTCLWTRQQELNRAANSAH
ncbi:hypothetical protein COV06_04435 [Candidatus Uhrbacteria bacterium CG10_big_fil_rev_8_21_14_0_10_50_16]|uniref:Uncharacterized protein n=1 Tax=Candidatus Uhrbacteria bacterium CG10_big_fil_rev_8_21_14_0_10_50_16 TaxID=1975039 RepID=A0A2H0RLF8_9BACT|nr:MAG: hypothetical protein COV06_04435 [Candidatus Uhrbacteria bacterium CG10_big_fil_rev_8_21_14_0_10_50_16]